MRRHIPRVAAVSLFVGALMAAAACSTSVEPTTTATTQPTARVESSATARTQPTAQAEPPTVIPASTEVSLQTLAAGEFRLQAAGAFGQPGFHEVLAVTKTVPQDMAATEGLRLVLALQDAGRSRQTCSRDHPLSGCATVDWSDAQSRPKVPSGGVFDNRITVQLASGERSFFLTASGSLSDSPNAFRAG